MSRLARIYLLAAAFEVLALDVYLVWIYLRPGAPGELRSLAMLLLFLGYAPLLLTLGAWRTLQQDLKDFPGRTSSALTNLTGAVAIAYAMIAALTFLLLNR